MGTETVANCTFIIKYLVEKMGPLRGDGNTILDTVGSISLSSVEKMGPLRGDGNWKDSCGWCNAVIRREDGSPSWGRKLESMSTIKSPLFIVEKMGPLRGDGNSYFTSPVQLSHPP